MERTAIEIEKVSELRLRLQSFGATDTDMTEEQQEKAAELEKLSDTAILRFLRGRKHDDNKAYRALLRYLSWRQEEDADGITKEMFPRELRARKLVPGDFRDKEGRPVLFVVANRHVSSDRDINEMKKFIIFHLDFTMKRTRSGEEKLVLAIDLASFTMACMDYEVLKMLIEILQFNYPEVLQVALVLNAPFIFSACWLIIRVRKRKKGKKKRKRKERELISI